MGQHDSSRIYELSKKANDLAKGQQDIRDRITRVGNKVEELEHEVLRRILFQVSLLTEEDKYGKPLQRVMDQSLEAIEAVEAFVKARTDCEEDPRLRLALGKIASVYAIAFRYVNEMSVHEYNHMRIMEAHKDD